MLVSGTRHNKWLHPLRTSVQQALCFRKSTTILIFVDKGIFSNHLLEWFWRKVATSICRLHLPLRFGLKASTFQSWTLAFPLTPLSRLSSTNSIKRLFVEIQINCSSWKFFDRVSSAILSTKYLVTRNIFSSIYLQKYAYTVIKTLNDPF